MWCGCPRGCVRVTCPCDGVCVEVCVGGVMCVRATDLMSSNSPSGGMKLMECSVSNLLSFTHWWN